MAMRMLMLLRVVSVVLAATPSSMLAGASAPRGRLAPARAQAILQGVADEISARYNCSVAAAFQSRHAAVAVASGFTDAGLGMGTKTRRGLPADPYVWGSITKMFTGPAVLQLVERGVMRLDDPIGLHVDPLLQQLNGTTLADHFGPDINDVQVHHLLHMTSGVKDYDGEKCAHACVRAQPLPRLCTLLSARSARRGGTATAPSWTTASSSLASAPAHAHAARRPTRTPLLPFTR